MSDNTPPRGAWIGYRLACSACGAAPGGDVAAWWREHQCGDGGNDGRKEVVR